MSRVFRYRALISEISIGRLFSDYPTLVGSRRRPGVSP